MNTCANDKIDYRLLNRLSNLVICSGCLRDGIITPIAQLISEHHALTNQCPACRDKRAAKTEHRRALGILLKLPRA